LEIGSVVAIGTTAAALAYALLKHHVFDISFVVNVTIVLALTSTAVLVLFTIAEMATESVLTRFTRTESIAANVIIACLTVTAIAPIHRRTDAFVDRMLFRKRHETETALRALAADVRLHSNVGELVQETADVLSRRLDVEGVAIYLRQNGGLHCVRATAEANDPVPLDDAAVRACESRTNAVDLSRYDTRLYGFRAYPIVLGGRLLGAVTLGHRHSHEAFAPDIDDAVTSVAESLGGSIAAIREAERSLV
jgi:hypothetical protein